MKWKIFISIIILIVSGVILTGYGPGKNTPRKKKLNVPKGWPKPNNIYKNNPLTEEGYLLGRKLFFDGRLSKDGEISCASCHQPFAAFANYDHDLSHGVNNKFTTRNAPGLFNLAWASELHWDGGINHIEVQPLTPLTAPNEMGETLENILIKLRIDTAYIRMFQDAFGDTLINSQRMLKALAQFTGTLISANSKYDRVMRGEEKFEGYEEKGYRTFKAKCAGCHQEPLFTDHSFRNNGRPLNRFNDMGRMTITGNRADSLKFKVPSLRNAQFTFPYMHDGSLFSLYQVVDHYRKGIQKDQPNLDPILKNGISMTDRERDELVLFLYTLSDSSFIRNPEYSIKSTEAFPHSH